MKINFLQIIISKKPTKVTVIKRVIKRPELVQIFQ